MLWFIVSTAFAQPDCIATAPLPSTRPSLSGEAEAVDSDDGRFRVHFTRDGTDTPGGTEGVDGVPEMVWRVLDGLEHGRETFLERGFRPVHPDAGEEGSDAVDVYITHLDSNGYATAVDGVDGETSCYIRINPVLGWVSGEVVESVAIHELHHCVQFAYTTNTHAFMYEATATFEQYRALSDETLAVALDILYVTRLTEPERKLHNTEGRYHYAGFLFLKFWSEYQGEDLARIPALWEQLALTPAWDEALDAAAQTTWGLSLDEVFVDFARFNAFACSRDDGQHYLPDSLGCGADVEVPHTSFEEPTGSASVSLENARYSASYARWEMATEGMLTEMTCAVPSDPEGDLRVLLAHLDGDGELAAFESMRVEPGAVLSLGVPNGAGGSTLAVFASVGEGPVTSTCTLDERDPEEKAGCGCTIGSERTMGWWLLPLLLSLRLRRGDDTPTGSQTMPHGARQGGQNAVC